MHKNVSSLSLNVRECWIDLIFCIFCTNSVNELCVGRRHVFLGYRQSHVTEIVQNYFVASFLLKFSKLKLSLFKHVRMQRDRANFKLESAYSKLHRANDQFSYIFI